MFRDTDSDAYEGPVDDDPTPAEGEPTDLDDIEAKAWHFLGRRLYQGRKRFQISKREAARRAGISESLWRQLEAGGREVAGRVVPPNPRPENLYAAIRAVDEDPTVLFADVGMQVPEGLDRPTSDDPLTVKIAHLNDRDRAVVTQLVDSMLAADNPVELGTR
jgi:transcriptional regulator with XRE-family HTH domain